MRGWHTIKTWSTTQTTVAMSSGEAGLYSLTKGAAQALGLMSLARDLGVESKAVLHTDANAALGIVAREGLGKLRHVNVQYLWLQDRLRGGEIAAKKVLGTDNPADLLTKNLAAHDVIRHSEALGHSLHDSRAEAAPALSRISEDEWLDKDGELIRLHRRPRTCAFTPLRIAGSPPAKTLTHARVTEGKFCASGQLFRRVDNWTARAAAHFDFGRSWAGTTRFVRVVQ